MQHPNWLQSIVHLGARPFVSNPNPQLGETVRLRLRCDATAPIHTIHLRTFPNGEQLFTPMVKEEPQKGDCFWSCDLFVQEPYVNYRFLITADDGVFYLSAAGVTQYNPLDVTDFKILGGYLPVEWVKTAVFYQIFPDRFANGNPETDPSAEDPPYKGVSPKTYPWEAPPDPEQPFPIVFYGGDLPGIVNHLDHIADLGINAIYLNPIFTAQSNHKYDVVDYKQVDPHFGGDEALVSLREALDQRRMRYLLDIVPNHCGYLHQWFLSAQEDAEAPEGEFFTFSQHPDVYECWLGVWTLAKLNYQSQALRDQMYRSDESVMQRWLKPPFRADGWRVDVANMLGRQGHIQIEEEVKREIRTAVKKASPDAYLMGENFFDGSPALQGDQWDANMNYAGFSTPLLHWLNGFFARSFGLKEPITSPAPWPTAALAQAWQTYLAAIPWAIALQQFNLVDSHDVPRIRTLLGENDALHRLAAIVQFTFPGVPCVYYGDEIGMVNDPHLDQRGCMIWDEGRWDKELLSFYKRLIALRRTERVLQEGGWRILLVEEEMLAYERVLDEGRFLTVACREGGERPFSIPLPSGLSFQEVFSRQTITTTDDGFNLPNHPQGATLWQQISTN